MKKKLVFWWGLFVIFVVIMVIPQMRNSFLSFSGEHAFIGSFIKFFVLASAGELAAFRLVEKRFGVPNGMLAKAVVWGFIGILILIFFPIFSSGIERVLELGYLPGKSAFIKAFYMSVFMNASFGVAMMAFHRVTDTWIEKRVAKQKMGLIQCIEVVDWVSFYKFVVLKTLPFFWIPMHTITFLLPSTYRVLMAASLSFALGILLAFGKRKR